MKNTKRQILIPLVLLGGVLLGAGCCAPTTSVGASSRSNRMILSLTSPVPTTVKCEWSQDGARVQHQDTTPFRLIVPAASVRELSLSKPIEAAAIEIKIQATGSDPGRFVMGAGTAGMRVRREDHRWEGQGL